MKQWTHGGNIYQYEKNLIDFSANINPLGMPQGVKQAIIDNINEYERYPDPNNLELTHSISAFYNVPKEKIVCGNGAADIIFRLALSQRPKHALIVSPTFSEYEKALTSVDCQVSHHFLLEIDNFEVKDDIFDSISNRFDIMFICNPNNPTGIPIKREMMLKIAQKCSECGILLVIDECFTDFIENEADYSVVADLHKLENVVILKAFTKIFAMAGVRLGFAFCSSEQLCQILKDTLQPWSVSTVASKAGVAALKEVDYIKKTQQIVAKNRLFLIESLKKLNFIVYPSQTNYVFFKSHIRLLDKLFENGILIRSCENYHSLNDQYYRIAVKSESDNAFLIKVLTKITEEQNG